MKKPNISFNIVEIFKEKRVRYGGYATLVTLAALVILIVINLIIQQVPAEIDMTENKLFTLSQQTYDLIEKLEYDLGKPVVTSNQASLWHTFRIANVREPIQGYGRLLREP